MAGNIKIIEPSSNFQKVSKDIIFNQEIDPLTLGIYVKIIALGKKWELNIGRFASLMNMSEDRVRKAFAKLEAAGYLRRERARDEHNRFIGWNYEVSTIPFSDMEVSRHPENPDVGNFRNTENSGVYNRDNKDNRDIKVGNRDNNTTPHFDFRSQLLMIGVSEKTADAWLAVRKMNRAANTEVAFDGIVREINKTGLPAEECIRTAAERSWRGFKAEWMQPRTPNPQAPFPRQESVFEHNARIAENIRKSLMGGTPYDEQ